MLVDAVLVQQFRRDGFVVVDGLITDAELDDYETLVTEAVARRKRDAPPLAERSAYAQSFHQCINLWEDYPDVRPLTFHPRSGRPPPSCSASTAVRLWHDQALYKEAGGRETDPHQDHGVLADRRDRHDHRVDPVPGSTMASGAMGYLPGSHPVGVRKFVNIFQGEDASVLMDLPEVAPSSRSSSKCRRAPSRSTTASPCTWRSRTSPTTTAPCTR